MWHTRRLAPALLALAAFAHAAQACAASYTWSGDGATPNWSASANWSGAAAPAAGEAIDTLEFPALNGGGTESVNDRDGLSARALAIDGVGYRFDGTGLSLGDGGLTVTPPANATPGSSNTIGIPLTLGADQTWSVNGLAGNIPNQVGNAILQPLSGTNRALTLKLGGGADLFLAGATNDLGPVAVTGADPGALGSDFNGSLVVASQLNAGSGHPVTVTHASLQANGAVGPLTLGAGAALRVGENNGPHSLSAPSVTLSSTSSTAFFLYGSGDAAATDYSQLQSTGPVALNGGLQVVDFAPNCDPLPRGQTYTLVTTTGALSGTFAGPADVSITPSGPCRPSAQRLHLAYGDHTVTATVVADDTTAPAITITTPTDGQHVDQGATVATQFSCSDDGGSGVASCLGRDTLDTRRAGAHTFIVTALDRAGNSATRSVGYVVDAGPDTTAPAVAISRPVAGQHFAQGAGVTPVLSCGDDGTGVATCEAPAALDTAAPGPHTFTVHATDHAGNARTQRVDYVVDAPGAHQPGWVSPFTVAGPSAAASSPGEPVVGLDAAGDAVAAWTHSDGSHDVVQAAVRPAGGRFSAPVTLSAPGEDASWPRVAVDAAGDAVVVWVRSGIVQAATRPAGGAFSPPVDVSGPDAASPEVGLDDAGDAVVVWTRSAVVQTASRTAGGTFSAPADLSVAGASDPHVAVAADGEAIATWTTQDQRLQAASRPAGGPFDDAVYVSPAGEIAWSGVAALGANGDAVAVYFQPGGTGPVVRAALRGHDGTWAAPTTLSAPAGASGLLQAGVDAAGTAVVAWEQWGAGLGDVVVQAAVRPPGGPFEPAADVAPGGIDPQLAVDAAGDSVLTWIGVDANGDIGTFGAIRPAGGAFSAGRLITPADVEATNWGLGIDGAGDALVVWLDADTNGVRATPYDATPPLLADVTVPATAVAGAAVPMAASASDAWSATSLSFDFGDGATGHGPSVTHAYAAPGDYHVRVTATDEAGNTSVATRDIAVAPAPVADTRPQPKPATPTPTPPAPSGGAAKTPPPAVVLAAKLTAAALAKGAPSTLSGLAAGSKVKMQILAGKKVVGRASATADKAGRAKLKLKLARKLAKQLRHKRLTVRYTLTAADGSTRVLTKHLKVG